MTPPQNYAQKTYAYTSAFKPYTPKSPVKSFRDLEIYQKALFMGVDICKEVGKNLAKSQGQQVKVYVGDALCRTALDLSKHIATAHSLRFSDTNEGINYLEKAMLDCNLLCVYLEQFQAFVDAEDIAPVYFEEKLREALLIRGKTLRLQVAWRKYSKT